MSNAKSVDIVGICLSRCLSATGPFIANKVFGRDLPITVLAVVGSASYIAFASSVLCCVRCMSLGGLGLSLFPVLIGFVIFVSRLAKRLQSQ